MTLEATAMYASLEAAIATCNKSTTARPINKIECCFQSANQYWAMLKAGLQGYTFPSAAEEAFFFRNTKPLFTSTIEYYGLLAHAQLFMDGVADKTEMEKFVNRELLRQDKFTEANPVFYDYYSSGATSNDNIWFVRANNDGGNFAHAKPYDLDRECTTRYDYLVSSLLALEKYSAYLRQL